MDDPGPARPPSPAEARFPAAADQLFGPIARFMRVESASGVVLLVAALVALALANSPWAERFLAFWETPLGFTAGGHGLTLSLRDWVNDGLMTIFFFVIGLEVKREIVLGELRDPRTAALPIAAALGGMIVPAVCYLALQWGEPTARGWGIPMATDIAFVVGCLALLGPRVPRSLRVLLLSLAIADDIGAILVIAVGYAGDLNLLALAWAVGGLALVVMMRWAGVRSVAMYVVVGALVWYAVHESGVHATVAGVALGLLTPARPLVGRGALTAFVEDLDELLQGDPRDDAPNGEGRSDPPGPSTNEAEAPANYGTALRTLIARFGHATREAISPLERLENGLHPYTSFAIMPLFALANAGVPLRADALTEPVATAVMAGLILGKPVGIVLFSLVAITLGLARRPKDVSWPMLAAGGVLAGIGFTMSLFIAELALAGRALESAKIGILIGSAICAVAGLALLWLVLPKSAGARAPIA